MHKRSIRNVLLAGVAVAGLSLAVPAVSSAQVSFGVNIGAEPVCPYGYYPYAPYNCAPYGYYGPQWFANGIFVGAGPWFHGPHGFVGPVNHAYDPHYGYHGPYPARGGHFAPPHDNFHSFHGNAFHDGGGHEMGGHDMGHGH